MRRTLLLNLMLALVWMAVTGSFTGTGFLLGFLLGYLIIRLLQPLIETSFYVHRIWHLIEFTLFVIIEIFRASIRIAADVLTPSHKLQPGVIAIPLEVESDEEITFFANLLSLTPGTLSLDVSDDNSTLYVHSMYVKGQDVEAERQRIKDQLERRVLKAFREPRESTRQASNSDNGNPITSGKQV